MVELQLGGAPARPARAAVPGEDELPDVGRDEPALRRHRELAIRREVMARLT
jgi:hypothetical protein